MQSERAFTRLVLNYMKKHGDTVDHDEAERRLAELDQEDAKSAEISEARSDSEALSTDGTPIEGETPGQGFQLTLVESNPAEEVVEDDDIEA